VDLIVIKTCLKCGADKPLEDFYKFFDKWSNKQYPSARCKPCHQQYRRDSPTTPRNRKSEKLQLRYGLNYEQWEKLRENEGHACMICGITESENSRRLDVDHCHSSGKVRGILCNPCNNMIAHAKDNVAVLRAAAEYLEENADGYKGYET
jgi:nitrate/TMAO reductase-like tetraheme cytochrome c subunit